MQLFLGEIAIAQELESDVLRLQAEELEAWDDTAERASSAIAWTAFLWDSE
jgi:hypothetical protein